MGFPRAPELALANLLLPSISLHPEAVRTDGSGTRCLPICFLEVATHEPDGSNSFPNVPDVVQNLSGIVLPCSKWSGEALPKSLVVTNGSDGRLEQRWEPQL